jgi:O-antigen ligase
VGQASPLSVTASTLASPLDKKAHRASARAASLMLLAGLVALPLYPKIGLVAVSGTYIPIRFDDLIVVAVGLVWLAALFVARRRPFVPLPLAAAAAAWLAVGLLSLLIGSLLAGYVPLLTGFAYWAKPIEYLLLGWIAYDLVAAGSLSVRSILVVVLATAAVVVGYGLLERLQLVPRLPGMDPPAGTPTSTIGDLHELAGYLGIVVLAALATWEHWSGWAKWAVLALALGAVSVIFFSGVRSEFIALGLCAALLAVVARPSRLPALLSLGLMLFWLASPALAAFGLGVAGIDAPTDTAVRLGDESLARTLEIRLQIKWPAFIADTMESPLLGRGPSAATEAADGYYIRAFVETGLLGLIAFVTMIGCTAWLLWRRMRQGTDIGNALALGMLMGTLFVTLVGVLIDSWVASRVMELYWPLTGAALAGAPALLASETSSRPAPTAAGAS